MKNEIELQQTANVCAVGASKGLLQREIKKTVTTILHQRSKKEYIMTTSLPC